MSEAGLQFRAAILGNLDKEIEAAKTRHYAAVQRAVFQTASEYQSKLRIDLANSGLANAAKMEKTWRIRKYPSRHGNDAAFVYSSWPVVVSAFEADTTIRSKDGWFLLVPNPEVWPSGRVSRRGKKKSSDDLTIAERRFGPLRYVYVRSNLSFLVADVRESASAPGTFKRASKSATRTGRGLATIVVFFLLPQVRLRQRLHSAELRKRAERDGGRRIEQLYIQIMNSDDKPQKVIAL